MALSSKNFESSSKQEKAKSCLIRAEDSEYPVVIKVERLGNDD